MNARQWLAGSLGLVCCMTAGCSLDDRLLTLPGVRAGRDAGADASSGGARELAPRLEVVPDRLDLGMVTTGFAARGRLAVRNAGDAPLPVPKLDWASGSSADLTLIQNLCERDVAPGESCEVRLQVVPSQAGSVDGALQVQSTAGNVDVAVTALGMAAGDLILAPGTGSFEDYGGVRVGVPEEGTFTLSNSSSQSTGLLQLGVNRPEFAFAAPAPGECVPGATSLEPAQSCNVRLAFTPAERGAVDAVLTISSEAAGSVSLAVAGRGLLPGVIQTSTPALDFASVLVGQSALRSVRFGNGGDEPLEITSVALQPEGVEGFTIQESDCGAATLLEGGASCSTALEFRPPRAGEELAAQLVVANAGSEQPLVVDLRGLGLLPGSLEIAAGAAGEEGFGDVLVGESLEKSFEVANPGAQPSGVLELTVSEGFELVTPPAEGDCVPGTTSLVDGQRCNVRVRFSPAAREPANGSLTVTSPLAGSVGFPLSGRGIVAGQAEAPPEANFGRVLTGASAQRTLKITNTGDQPLAPPTLAVSGNDAAQKAAFTLAPGCTEPVEVGADCELTLTFAPTLAVPHAASLDIASGASTTSVLLLGEALVPGSLVLAPAPDSSNAFGDVEIGTTATQSFTLTNPGAEPSGAVTITTDNNQFAARLGDCNQGDPAGLVDGASCTFSVAFSPTASQPAAANVSVQSPGAGRAGVALTGRGRTRAALAGAGTRDFGRAVIGAAAVTVPENESTWAISNTGDLPTGMLVVTNDNPTEFVVGKDECTGVAVAGKGTCQIALRFRPGETARRTGSITVRDPAGMSSAVLAVSGTGVRLAGPGQSCRDAECQTGECTPPTLVCCNRICGTCEECSPEGTCVPQAVGSPCGDPASGSQCFGANACKLPSGSRCSSDDAAGDSQCGRGHCEQRLGGSGASDRVCCDAECPAGSGCNAQGTGCEQPALGAGEPCDPAAPRCAAGMDCKRCRGTARDECTPQGQCCGDCGSGFACFGGECKCADENGDEGLDCGPGACAIVRDGACCPQGNPGCAPNQVCDFVDHLCKQCVSNSDCTDGVRTLCDTEGDHSCKECLTNDNCTEVPTNARPECGTDGVCRYPCDGPNFVDCNGACIAAGACCCSGDDVCQPDGVTCAPRCTDGTPRCSAGGVPQLCQNGVFVDQTACATGTQCEGGECRASLGFDCGVGGACASGGSCASNNICCSTACTGKCQACARGTGLCENHQTSAACPTILCIEHAPECSTAAPNPQPAPPEGEGQCSGPDTCATSDQLCSQPFMLGGDCFTDQGAPGTCSIDGVGALFCVATPLPPPVVEPPVEEPPVSTVGPPVICGISSLGDICDGSEVCCLSGVAGSETVGCQAGTTCPGAVNIRCDEAADCGGGQVCCVDPGAGVIECRDAGACTGGSGPICISASFIDPFVCSTEQPNCTALPQSSTWAFCAP